MEFETRAIHDGQEPIQPRAPSSPRSMRHRRTCQEQVGQHKGYEYSRTGNPTRTALQECLASWKERATALLSRAPRGIGRSLAALSPGDHIVIPERRLWRDVPLGCARVRAAGLLLPPVDMTSLEALGRPGATRTKMVWIESPTNPLLTVR